MSIAEDPVRCGSTDACPTSDRRARPPIFLFALSGGVIVTNLFAAQPLTALIGPAVGLDLAAAGLVSMLALLGYAAGLFFIVPLADLMENRKLILGALAGASLMAAATALAPTEAVFLVASFGLGVGCCVIQILVPLAAGMAPEAERGRVVGEVMSGVMFGILLSRPLASLIADSFGWRGFYAASCVAMAGLGVVLAGLLPRRAPEAATGYGALIASLATLLRAEPLLRRRAFTSSLSMAAFSLFWTTVALRLAASPFDLTQRGIAIFALVGAAGAVAAPLSGRAGDRGFAAALLAGGHVTVIAGALLALWAGEFSSVGVELRLALLGLAAILIDVGVTRSTRRSADGPCSFCGRRRVVGSTDYSSACSSSGARSVLCSPARPGASAAGRSSRSSAPASARSRSVSTSSASPSDEVSASRAQCEGRT